MKTTLTQSIPWKVVFISIWMEIVNVESRPYRLSGSLPLLPGPDVLKSSKGSITDISEMLEVSKLWQDPTAKDLNQTDLLRKLGTNFHSLYMSVDPPKSSRRKNGLGLSMRSASIRRQDAVISKMPWRIRKLQFEVKRSTKKRGRILGYRASSKLKQWLWELSRCPINYSWIDYGPKFFPRYMRYGKCIEKQCSFPNGMTCRPRSTIKLTLLMWVCPSGECHWSLFTLEMSKSCQCSCKAA